MSTILVYKKKGEKYVKLKLVTNSITTQLWHNYIIIALKTTPQPHHMLAAVQIFIVQYLLIKERQKKGFILYYKVITQGRSEIYMFGIGGMYNLPVSIFLIAFLKEATVSNFLISSGTS